MLHGEQIRAARALLGWNQAELAKRAKVGEMTVKRFESRTLDSAGNIKSIKQIRDALEAAGIVFIQADESGGVGVRLLK